MSRHLIYSVVITIFLVLFGSHVVGSEATEVTVNQAALITVNETKLDICTLKNLTVFENGESTNGQAISFCIEECLVNPVLSEILCSIVNKTSECTFFNEVGIEIETCSDLTVTPTNEEGEDKNKGQRDIENLYVVDEARIFVFPAFEIGHKAILKHLLTPINTQQQSQITSASGDSNETGNNNTNHSVMIETLSISPRVFRLYNFFSTQEASALIQTALAQTEATHVLKRSSVGSEGYTQSSQRTSENAFDTSSPTAMDIKHRGFDLLGIRPYDETFADGLQVLRYNRTAAYIPHLDWLDPGDPEHDYESDGIGTNRFATIFLYLTDVKEGGETVFIHAAKDGTTTTSGGDSRTSEEIESEVDAYLTLHNATHLFPRHTWERNMVTQCRTKLAVKPRRADAILFYSQLPDGRADDRSTHGGCPVILGEKWAANLWVWNGPRKGYTQRNTQTRRMELSYSGKQLSTWGWFLPLNNNTLSTDGDVNTNIASSSVNWKKHDRKAKAASKKISAGADESTSSTSSPASASDSILVTFQSLDTESAALYWQDTSNTDNNADVNTGGGVYFGELSLHHPPIRMNSYPGHSWTVRRGERVVAVWVVRELDTMNDKSDGGEENQPATQLFTLNTSGNSGSDSDKTSINDEL